LVLLAMCLASAEAGIFKTKTAAPKTKAPTAASTPKPPKTTAKGPAGAAAGATAKKPSTLSKLNPFSKSKKPVAGGAAAPTAAHSTAPATAHGPAPGHVSSAGAAGSHSISPSAGAGHTPPAAGGGAAGAGHTAPKAGGGAAATNVGTPEFTRGEKTAAAKNKQLVKSMGKNEVNAGLMDASNELARQKATNAGTHRAMSPADNDAVRKHGDDAQIIHNKATDVANKYGEHKAAHVALGNQINDLKQKGGIINSIKAKGLQSKQATAQKGMDAAKAEHSQLLGQAQNHINSGDKIVADNQALNRQTGGAKAKLDFARTTQAVKTTAKSPAEAQQIRDAAYEQTSKSAADNLNKDNAKDRVYNNQNKKLKNMAADASTTRANLAQMPFGNDDLPDW